MDVLGELLFKFMPESPMAGYDVIGSLFCPSEEQRIADLTGGEEIRWHLIVDGGPFIHMNC